jgi:Uma2 family endonuclease
MDGKHRLPHAASEAGVGPPLTVWSRCRKLRAMNALLAPLVESPQLVLYVNELQAVIEAERSRREQFYEDISPEDKWEFINGEVIMHSPATAKHTQVRARISRLLGVYVDIHKLGVVLDEKALVCFTRNDYEPDIVYFDAATAAKIADTQWKMPVPQMVVEVLSPSSRSRDCGYKYTDYAAHAVQEYWIVDPEQESIEQHLLDGQVFRLAGKRKTGSLKCTAIPGFVMPIRAAFDEDENLKALWALQPKS